MNRRNALRLIPAVATVPVAGCLEATPGGREDEEGEYPDEWRSVEPLDSEYVAFDGGSFDTEAGAPPEEGASLDGREAWELVTEMEWTLRESSFRLAYDADIIERESGGRWRWTLWRDATRDVVHQRMEGSFEDEGEGTTRMYNDGTRYVAATDGDETEYYHVPDPHWHRDRVDSHLLMGLFQLLEFEVEETITVDETEYRRSRGVGTVPEDHELESAAFFTGMDGIVRNAHADYGNDPETEDQDRFAFDGSVEITAGTPTIEKPDWTDDADLEERDPVEPV